MSPLKAVFLIRLNMLRHKMRGIKKHSRLKIVVIGIMVIGLFAGTFYVPLRAFIFLDSIGQLGTVIIDRLIYLLFMGLFIMLIFSNLIISYSTVYRAKETDFLFTLPLSHEQIFFAKFVDSIIMSSWTFLCFLLPILSAYAVVRGLGWHFYAALFVFFGPFAVLAGALGSIGTMLLIGFIPRRVYRFLGIIAGALFAGGCAWLFFTGRAAARSNNEVAFLLTNFIPHFGFSQFAFAPNFWISEGIFKVAAEDLGQSLFWWLLMVSNALFFVYALLFLSGKIYYSAWLKSADFQVKKNYAADKSALELLVSRMRFLRPYMSALIIKDIKVFLRDPVQWTQFMVFFGLLGIYFANIRNLGYQHVLPFWKNIISFLNLASTNLTLASLCVRFVFPQLSLEGKRFWILGLAPLEKKQILFEKFWLNGVAALSISLPLILISNYMLNVSARLMWLSVFVVILMSFSLISLCIGLGTLFPNFKEDNPAQIVSGFGGTLALVLCLAYIGVNVAVLAVPFHLFVTGRISPELFDKLFYLSAGFVFVLSLLTITLSLSGAVKVLERLEV